MLTKILDLNLFDYGIEFGNLRRNAYPRR